MPIGCHDGSCRSVLEQQSLVVAARSRGSGGPEEGLIFAPTWFSHNYKSPPDFPEPYARRLKVVGIGEGNAG